MYKWLHTVLCIFAVTPHAGVRIEIRSEPFSMQTRLVTPHAGVRIEIRFVHLVPRPRRVTPHAGVRIEIHGRLC